MPQTICRWDCQKGGLADSGDVYTAADMMRSLEKIEELPALSTVAVRLNQMLQDLETTADQLAEEISKDQSMVTKLLKLANSSFFGLTSRVSDISHAVMVLGFKTVLDAVFSMAVIDAFSCGKGRLGIDMGQFWRHAVRVAVVSRDLARSVDRERIGNAFTAGIIHDIGKVVMARCYAPQFETLWRFLNQSGSSFFMAEQQHFPLGHAGVGAFLTRRWHLPEELTAVVGRHHCPELAGEPTELVLIVHTADAIVNRYIENRRPVDQWPICDSARNLLDQKIETIEKWLPSVADETAAACSSFLAP